MSSSFHVSRRTMMAGVAGLSVLPLIGCESTEIVSSDIEIFDPEMSRLVSPSARIETLSEGYGWSEGPAWDRSDAALYFTDVPGNKAYKWTQAGGTTVLLDPSGATNVEGFREPGANGLLMAQDGSLLACNHGLRRVERINLDTGERTPLVSEYEGEPFNSPNDLIQSANGTLYFTDPPYGLDGLNDSPLKRQDANGVYRLNTDGTVERLLDDMTFPNGIALSPDERSLYISQSDPDAPILRRLTLSQEGDILADDIIFDAKPYMDDAHPGLPDGMAVAASGHIFLTGPGGVFVLSDEGRPLGRILTGKATANCAFGEDGSTLFMTAHNQLKRVQTLTRGVQWAS